MSTLADTAISSDGAYALDYESGPEHSLNLSETFICTRIESHPQMTFKACEARQSQSTEKDNEGIYNNLSECRGCGGWGDAFKVMRKNVKEKRGRQQAEVIPDQPDGYHLGENTTHDKFPCQCCGAKVWITGGYCTSCKGQFVYAAQHGLSRQEAIPILRRYFENRGVRPRRGGKNNNAKNLIDWEGEKADMGGKKGTCGCCKRADMSLPQQANGFWVCGTCLIETKKGLTFDEIRAKFKAKETLSKIGNKVDHQTDQAATDKENLTADGLHNSPQKEQPGPAETVTAQSPTQTTKKRKFPVLVLTVTEREEKILKWVDEVGKKNRRERKEQVWAILEDLMEKAAVHRNA